eukprot:2656639-Amphidinium_carterae.1
MESGTAMLAEAQSTYVPVTAGDREKFIRDGYIVMKNTLDAEEVAIVMKTMEQSSFLSQYEMNVDSSLSGKPGKQTIWDKPGNGAMGALTRSERVVGVADFLLGGGGVHHYFNKMLRKEAGNMCHVKTNPL